MHLKFSNIALMARGLTLFNNLIEDEAPVLEKQQKGRSKALISKRDELLLDRLYFFKKTFRLDYDYVLEVLSGEFFLTEGTIPRLIEKAGNQPYIRTLRISQPERNELEKKWPHLVWDEKRLMIIYGMPALKTA